VHQQNIELSNRSKVIEELKVSLTLLLDKYNELKKNYDKKINTFMVAPLNKNIHNSINKESGKFNSSRLYIERSSLQLNLKNPNNALIIESFKKKVSIEEFEKMAESLNNLNDKLKDKEKYSKMKDAEIKRLELIVKEYELVKISLEELNKKHLELKKYNESILIELDFFKEERENIKNERDILMREKFINQDLINNSRKNQELFQEYQNKYLNIEKICTLKTQENNSLEDADKAQKELIEILKEEKNHFILECKKLKENINLLETELLKEKEKNMENDKKNIEDSKAKEEKIKSLEIRIEGLIANEIKYIQMLTQIKDNTKLSYENLHKLFLDQEKKYEKKLKELKAKLDTIKMKIVKKINSKFIEGNNILSNLKSTNKGLSNPVNNNNFKIVKISVQNKFEILGISSKNSIQKAIIVNNTNIKSTVNGNNVYNSNKENHNLNKNIKQDSEKSEENLVSEYLEIIENYKKSVNELKNDLKDKLIKMEKHEVEKNKLIYQIQNYERFMKESEKKTYESNEKVIQMELVINQLNSKLDIINKENLKVQKNISSKLKEELIKEEISKKEYLQQIVELRNQLQQYKIENQGKSRIIEERNEEIKLLKSQIK